MHQPLAGSRVLLITHEWSLTGAPLLLAETTTWLHRLGAEPWYVNLGATHPEFPAPPLWTTRALDADDSLAFAQSADLVIANTAAAAPWLERADPQTFERTLWWIHEVDRRPYLRAAKLLPAVAAAVFDSAASLAVWGEAVDLPADARVIHPGLPPSYSLAPRWVPPPLRERGRRRARVRARVALDVRPGEFLVGCFASYHAQKGQDLLGSTLAAVKIARPELPLKALFVGFPDTDVARGFIERLPAAAAPVVGDRVMPQLSNVAPLYPALDALIVNTQEPGEAFGRVILEAMAHAIPILATSGGGVPEVVSDGVSGLLHPFGDQGQETLMHNIEALADDRSLARRLGRAGEGRLRAEFTLRRFEHEFLAVIEAMLARRSPGSVSGGQKSGARAHPPSVR